MTMPVPELPEPIPQIVGAMEDRKALDVVVLDLRTSGAFTDYFVVASGRTTRQGPGDCRCDRAAPAFHRRTADACRRVRPPRNGCSWTASNVIVHVFTRDTRGAVRPGTPLGQRSPHRAVHDGCGGRADRRLARSTRPPGWDCRLLRERSMRSWPSPGRRAALCATNRWNVPRPGIICASCWRRVRCIKTPICDRCGVGVPAADQSTERVRRLPGNRGPTDGAARGGRARGHAAQDHPRLQVRRAAVARATPGATDSKRRRRLAPRARTSRFRFRCIRSGGGGGASTRRMTSPCTSACQSSRHCGARVTRAGRPPSRASAAWARSGVRSRWRAGTADA